MEKYSELRKAVASVPAIDAHAHNIVALDSEFPFLRCFSEAEGDALSFAPETLSFKRSIMDLSQLYNCTSSFNDVQSHRESLGLLAIGSKCFTEANICAIFIDDGIMFDKMHEWKWHSCFTPAVGRILRIEYLAEKILNGWPNDSKVSLESFMEVFMGKLKSAANNVVALKSIAAYRSGLEINTHVSKKAAEEGLLEDINAKGHIRIQNKNLIDYIFTCSLEVALYFNVPIQIHTGFGDKDLDLKLCNPLLLRGLLEDERFSKCRYVLLHASYPFTREASYLAAIYSHVYLDFGLAVPKLSVHGMTSSVKELLELAPVTKVMFSSDGYAFPETFYLGAKRAREVIYSVFSSACDEGDLTVPEAIESVQKIFRKNALEFYNLDKVFGSIGYSQPLNIRSSGNSTEHERSMLVRVAWVDNSGKCRCRVIPAKRFYDDVMINGVGLAFAIPAMSSFSDAPVDGGGLTAVGEVRLIPDLSTKHSIPWVKREEMVLADMHIKPGEAWEYCPRSTLQRISEILKEEFNLVINAGFENEFFLLKNTMREVEEWVSFDSTSYCSTFSYDALAPILQEIFLSLDSMGILVEQLHAESGHGQFEIALRHTICKCAADNLIFARVVIRSIARKHGLLATFVPKYFPNDIGSGCHVHLSLWENGKNVFMASEMSKTQHGMSKVGESFMAGVLHHLPSILAIISPLPNSYDRIQPNTWSGAYQCWGKENREAPLRACCPPGVSDGYVSNFEIKSFDGCANPHLGLASIIASGIYGLRQNLSLPDPLEVDPTDIHSKVQRLPKELSESVAALDGNIFLKELLGEKLVRVIIAIRKAEIKHYATNKDAFKQLIHEY